MIEQKKLVLAMAIALMTPAMAVADLFSNTNIDFNEPAFPTVNGTSVSGTVGYNVINDTSGVELAALDGGLNDISMTFSSTGASGWQWQTGNTGQFTARHSFLGTPASNNPGTIISNTAELDFASHLKITDFSFDASSLNSAGVAWEYSVIEFLDVNGDHFSPPPTIGAYLSHSEINGSPSQGVYVLDSKATLSGVGGNLTASGTSNPNENFTVTGDLAYSDVGLSPGTQISGIRLTTFLQDVRGTGNGNTNVTSSLIDFTFSGETINAVPEPSSLALLGLTAGGLLFYHLRKQRCALVSSSLRR